MSHMFPAVDKAETPASRQMFTSYNFYQRKYCNDNDYTKTKYCLLHYIYYTLTFS